MLRELAKEITDPVGEYRSVAAWHRRAFGALNRLMGSDSTWSQGFEALADDLVLPDPSLAESWDIHNFEERFRRATGVLMAAAEDLQSQHHEANIRCSHEEKKALLLNVDQDGQPDEPFAGSISFANLDETDFEEFCHDFLIAIGFVNVDWRKGTPKKASPSDRGRDLVAHREQVDVDGHRRFETWFVDCKHYKRGVPPEALQGLMTWSQSERPDVALVAASGFLSNPAKDWLSDYERNQRPPFRIRYWERPTLIRLLRKHPRLLQQHGILVEPMRT